MARAKAILCCSITGFFTLVHAIVLPNQQVLESASEATSNVLHVRHELRKAEIIPTVLDDFVPSATLDIAWQYKETDEFNLTAALGNTLRPSDLQNVPRILLDDDPKSFPHASDLAKEKATEELERTMVYVVTLTDPDAPSRDDPEWSEFCHWIFTIRDKPGANVTDVLEYKPPGPPKKTGKHRYVFTAWIAANRTTSDLHLSKPKGRKHWGYNAKIDGDAGRVGVRKWAADNGLLPIAANFIYAQHKKQ